MNPLQEDNGNYSALRLMALLCILAGIACAGLGFFLPGKETYALNCLQSLLSAAFLGKVGQKFFEEKVR